MPFILPLFVLYIALAAGSDEGEYMLDDVLVHIGAERSGLVSSTAVMTSSPYFHVATSADASVEPGASAFANSFLSLVQSIYPAESSISSVVISTVVSLDASHFAVSFRIADILLAPSDLDAFVRALQTAVHSGTLDTSGGIAVGSVLQVLTDPSLPSHVLADPLVLGAALDSVSVAANGGTSYVTVTSLEIAALLPSSSSSNGSSERISPFHGEVVLCASPAVFGAAADIVQPPLFVPLSGCRNATATASGGVRFSACTSVEPISDSTLSGTVYSVCHARVFVEAPSAGDLPLAIDATEHMKTQCACNVTVHSAVIDGNLTATAYYEHDWEFTAVGALGGVWSRNKSSPQWSGRGSPPFLGDPDAGLTAVCYDASAKDHILVAGGRNYGRISRTGAAALRDKGFVRGGGFIARQHGSVSSPWSVVFGAVGEGGSVPSITGLDCKGGALPFIACGEAGLLLHSTDAVTWNVAITVAELASVDFYGVGCVGDLFCLAAGSTESGRERLDWTMSIAISADGGATWFVGRTVPGERPTSVSCVYGTSFCAVATETYTGSRIYFAQFDLQRAGLADGTTGWQPSATFPSEADPHVHCQWADECTVALDAWQGRFEWRATMRRTRYSGSDGWPIVWQGGERQDVGSCTCGGYGGETCFCVASASELRYSALAKLPDLQVSNITEISSVNVPVTAVTFGVYAGGASAHKESYFAADVLRILYYSMGGPTWKRSDNWLVGSPCINNWYGVTCGTADAKSDAVVRKLILVGNNLTGSIPPAISSLSELHELVLPNNNLSGDLPTSMVRLSQLQRLELYGNQLTGAIPEKINHLSSLRMLALFNNKISGTLPFLIGSMAHLRWLMLHNNRLTGPVPAAISRLSELVWLRLDNNFLSGTMPSSLGDMSLKGLDLSRNSFSGTRPPVAIDAGLRFTATYFDICENPYSSPGLRRSLQWMSHVLPYNGTC